MKRLSDNFIFAAIDYRYLLERHYPQKVMLKMVGDRYALNGTERTMLYRGITTAKQAGFRKQKTITLKSNAFVELYIDGFNVLITIGNYLLGKTTYLATDGFVRDAAELDGKSLTPENTSRSMKLVLEYLCSINPGPVYIYLDQSLDPNQRHYRQIGGLTGACNIQVTIESVVSADQMLMNKTPGVCATSDSTIVDRTLCPVIDLARETLEYHFTPVFTNLESVI